MGGLRGYALFEQVVARAMTARDPAAAMRRAGKDARLPEGLRRSLLFAGEDGVRMAALLVARLRFERLMHGSIEAAAWFERDPEAFTGAFRRYHAEVAPAAFFPAEEARLFSTWLEGRARPRRRARKGHK